MINLAWLGEDGQVHTVKQNQNSQHLLGATYQPTMQNLVSKDPKIGAPCPPGSVNRNFTSTSVTKTDKNGVKTVTDTTIQCDGNSASVTYDFEEMQAWKKARGK